MSTNKTQALIEHASAAALLVSPLVAAAVGYAAFAPAPANALSGWRLVGCIDGLLARGEQTRSEGKLRKGLQE